MHIKNCTYHSILFIFLFAINGKNTITAQESYVSFGLGGTIPVGNFGKQTDVLTDGYAKSGANTYLTWAYYPTKYKLGIVTHFAALSNIVDNNALKEDIFGLLQDDVKVEFIKARWDFLNLSAGPQYTLGKDKYVADIYVLAGVMLSKTPKIRASIMLLDSLEINKDLYYTAPEFGITIGANFRVNLSQKLGCLLNCNYMQTAIRESILGDDILFNNVENYSLTIQNLNFGLGLYYRL